MTGELAIAVDDDSGQLVAQGAQTGAAGGAVLEPTQGLSLLYDRVSGQLSRLTLELPGVTSDPYDEVAVRRVLRRLFGAEAAQVIGRTSAGADDQPAVVQAPATPAAVAYSLLARQDAARATSPVPASPLWPAEAALLAHNAGLRARARAEAARAAPGLAELLARIALPATVQPLAALVGQLAARDVPEAAASLGDPARRWFDGELPDWLAEHRPPTAGPAPREQRVGAGCSPGGPRWALDLALVPPGVLLPALMPGDDLVVRPSQPCGVEVRVRRGPQGSDAALRACQARLVDPRARAVIAEAPLTPDGIWVRAVLPGSPQLVGCCIELVSGPDRPVLGEQSRRLRRALRWADFALRAERQPFGLAPGLRPSEWGGLAATGWQHCRRSWEAAGDRDRAAQAPGGPASASAGYLTETLGLG